MYLDDTIYPVEVVVEAVGKQAWFIFPTASLGSGDWAGGVVYANQNLFGRDVQLLSAGQIGQSNSYAFVGYRDPLVVGAPLTYAMSALYRREADPPIREPQPGPAGADHRAGGDGSDRLGAFPAHARFLGVSARYQKVKAPKTSPPDAAPLPYNSRGGRIFLLQFQFQFDNTRAQEGLRQGILPVQERGL